MTNGQQKFETKSKIKVKSYCFTGAKKITEPERVEQSLELVASYDHWPTAWSLRQKPVAASAVSSAAA